MKNLGQLFTLLCLMASGLIFVACPPNKDIGPAPVITEFSPSYGVAGSFVQIKGNHFFAPVTASTNPVTNTSIVKFNGTVASVDYAYQDDVDKQRINTTVPVGATSGKITITANGVTTSSLDNFTVVAPEYVPNVTVSIFKAYCGYGMTSDAGGNIYLATGDCSGSYPASIVKISAGGTVTNLLENEFAQYGIAVDANQNVYASVGNQIKKITPNGTVSILAGGTDAGDADGQGTNARFRLPYGVAADADGNVYVADLLNHKIRKITPGGAVSTLAGSSQGFADGTGASAQFNIPAGITLDRDRNVLVTEWGDSKIRRITPGGLVSTVAGSTSGYNDGPVAQAQFNLPNGIVVDANGTIYVSDEGNFVVRRITSNGNVSTVAGSCFGYADGSGASAKFGNVRGIALDASGNIYVSDADNGKIRKIVIN